MDIYCQKCDEPYDVCYVVGGDMDAEWNDWDGDKKPSQRFLKGEGCPCCKWGENAPKEQSMRGVAMSLLSELLEDDVDGMASMMDDFEYMGLLNE